jgi:hypothetical protein
MRRRIFTVVPAKAGTHNHRIQSLTTAKPQAKATASVPSIVSRGVWVPAFAGTTG